MAQGQSRSGVVGLIGRRLSEDAAVAEHLRRARFMVVDATHDVPSDRLPQAVVIGLADTDDVQLTIQGIRARLPHAALIGFAHRDDCDVAVIVQALRAGLNDAVVAEDEKAGDLSSAIKIAIEKRRIETAQSELSTRFTRELGARTREVQAALGTIEQAYEDTLRALVGALDTREKATAGHSLRVTYYCAFLAHLLGAGAEDLKHIYRGALLHDIGKIGIPDAILLKPARLDDAEWVIMRRHTELGRQFLSGISYLAEAIDIPYSHHEWWDGSGYPRGLSGRDIPFAARVFAVADVYDALRSKRTYKESMTFADSQEIIRKETGTHFDPEIVDVFLSLPEAVWKALDAYTEKPSSFETVLDAVQTVAARFAEYRPAAGAES